MVFCILRYKLFAIHFLQEDNRDRSSEEIAHSVIPSLQGGHMYGEIQLLGLLMEREGEDFVVGGHGRQGELQCGMTVRQRLKGGTIH